MCALFDVVCVLRRCALFVVCYVLFIACCCFLLMLVFGVLRVV